MACGWRLAVRPCRGSGWGCGASGGRVAALRWIWFGSARICSRIHGGSVPGSAGSPGPQRGQRGEVNPRSGEAHGREAGGCQVAPKARLDGPKGDGGACGHAHKARRRLADAQPLRRKSVRLTGPASGARRPAPPAVVGRARSGGNGKGKACCGDKGEARQDDGFDLGSAPGVGDGNGEHPPRMRVA